MKLIIIAAVSIDGVIGIGNEIPWRIPEDFKHFRNTTINNVLIIGYNTYLTLPEKAFEHREYLVLNGGNSFKNERHNVYQFNDVELLLKSIEKMNTTDKIYIAGGASIYDLFIDKCDEVIITWVNKTYLNGDKKFPLDKLFFDFIVINDQNWQKSVNNLQYKITYYKRNNGNKY